jgi:hypothetical protein
MKKLLANDAGAYEERAIIDAALKSIEDYQVRAVIDPGQGYYRPLTQERKEGIVKFYEQTALSLFKGFSNRMDRFVKEGDTRQKRIANLFTEVQK